MPVYIEVPSAFGVYHHHPAADIHPEATIARGVTIDLARIGMAEIGELTEIGDFTTVMDGVSIGKDSSIRRNVVIHEEVAIGSKVEIQDQASIPTGTTVQSCVSIGPGVKFTNEPHPRAFIPKRPWVPPQTIVRFGATIGANATVACEKWDMPIMIGEFSSLAAGSTATRSLRPFGLYAGNEQQGWVNAMGYTLSDNPNTVPPDNDLLGGLLMIPEHLRPHKRMLSEILQYARADL